MNFYEDALKRNGLPPQWSRQMVEIQKHKDSRSGTAQRMWGHKGRFVVFAAFRPDHVAFDFRQNGEWLASFSVNDLGQLENVVKCRELTPA